MRGLLKFSVSLLTIFIILLFALLLLSVTGEIVIVLLLTLAFATFCYVLLDKVVAKINTKYNRIDEKLARERRAIYQSQEVDPETGMVYIREYDRHLLENQKIVELLPPSDAVTFLVEIAASLRQTITALHFDISYVAQIKHLQSLHFDINEDECYERLQKGLAKTFENSKVWPKIKPQLAEKSIAELLHIGLDEPYVTEIMQGFYLRDTALTEKQIESFWPGRIFKESALIPAVSRNYPLLQNCRFMLHQGVALNHAQLFTGLADTGLLYGGFYHVADRFEYQGKTMILLVFQGNGDSVTELDILERGINKVPTALIELAREFFKDADLCERRPEFASESWKNTMTPVLGEE